MTTPLGNPDRERRSDCCRPAVERAFRELRACGQPGQYCLEAAVTVYRWHHPEVLPDAALRTVQDWIAPLESRGQLH